MIDDIQEVLEQKGSNAYVYFFSLIDNVQYKVRIKGLCAYLIILYALVGIDNQLNFCQIWKGDWKGFFGP